MKVYTHATVGVTTTLFISKLLNAGVSPDLIISLIVGVLGGIIPDVDLPEKNDSVSKKSKKKRIKIILIVSILLMILFWKLSEDIDFDKLISSIIIFIAFIFIFTKQPHRHFSHSILGIGIIAFTMGRINFVLGVIFIVALLSHLALDIFNKKPVHLINFIPKFKKGFCFKVVNSDNPIVNMVITGISITLSLFLLILMTKK